MFAESFECLLRSKTVATQKHVPVRTFLRCAAGIKFKLNKYRSVSSWNWWPSWRPTSTHQLRNAETKILDCVQNDLWARFVSLPTQDKIWTVSVTHKTPQAPPNPASQRPLVMVHGLCGGVGLWIRNLDPLCRSRPVLVFDLLGFGRSSHPRFPTDPSQAEQLSVDSIEHWRQALGLESMILLGHSLGGYLATSYAIQHPKRVKHLILVDPWGFEHIPEDGPAAARPGCPYWVEGLISVASRFNPLAGIRAAGPWGPKLIHRFRPDIKSKFEDMFDDQTMTQYIYHCNAQNPSGEVGFRIMSESMLWAKRPMLDRVHLLPAGLPVTLIYGARSWMDSKTGNEVAKRRPTSYTQTVVVKGASHHVYADQPEEFNRVVQSICDSVVD
ncbi:(Lyso)-N-acylphosphatidylethanolamine lipase-like isoform X2 [Alosa alosa]|uniref:(Lyso)-N-acylphosphatidylethanolamine lipase-like isoform X2 n=1 Tax=Alosa alosa TaxID=278164 RepID=UPI0020152209|nr:(Lyso)-N-acylphosphatidylethanolamine lipase-like isoform X2 [Alosa alosa]